MFLKGVLTRILIMSFLVLITSCGGGSEPPSEAGGSVELAGNSTGSPGSSETEPSGDSGTEPSLQPELSGQPLSTINELEVYSFNILAKNFLTQTLAFSIENKPSWANFNSTTGSLIGTPSYDDAGIYSDIKISATDGTNALTLPSFSISVADIYHGPTIPIFEPAQIINDDNGNIYLLDKENNTIFPWVAEKRHYSNPIFLDKNQQINSITYSSEHNRLYILYENVGISFIDLSLLDVENIFLLNTQITNINAAGNHLLVVDSYENRLQSYSSSAELIDSISFYSDELEQYIFDDVNDITYYSCSGYCLEARPISAEGFWGIGKDIDFDSAISGDLKFSPDFTTLLSTGGQKSPVIRPDLLEQVLPSEVIELQYFENEVITIEAGATTERTMVNFYQPDDFTFLINDSVNGEPLALLKGQEVAHVVTFNSEVGISITTYDLNDSDHDGLSHYVEVNLLASNPLQADTDSDGMPDFYEWKNQLLINSDDALADEDNDNLSNVDEYTYGSSIHDSDSDNDGLSDGEEVHSHLTMPLNWDSDGDNIPDGWEITNTLNPLESSDALSDLDNDSFINFEEFYLGSNPIDSNDIPERQTWSSFQGGADNSGYVATHINPENLNLRWSITPSEPASSYTSSSIVATQGKVITTYSTTFNKVAAGFSAADGSLIWQTLYGDIYAINPPSIADNKVYFQAGAWEDSHLYTLDVEDGSEIFATPYTNKYTTHESPTIFEDYLYVSAGGGVHKLDKETGAGSWYTQLSHCEDLAPAVNESSVYYYNGSLKILNKSTGVMLNTATENQAYDCSTPVLGINNNVFVISDDGLIAFDATTASVLWQINNEISNSTFTGTAAVGGGKVYTIYDDSLKVFDEFTGEELWSWSTGYSGGITRNIVLTMNLVFVSGSSGTYAIDITTHQPVWHYDIAGLLSLSLDGALYIQSSNGIITAINIGGDSDGDRIDDWWEKIYGLDPSDSKDGLLNPDGDALTHLQEFNHKTNPFLADSDGDGLSDDEEVNTHFSNPNNSDTDDDGMPDLWEINQGFDLLASEDALLDLDNDTVTNVDEYFEQTDPNDENSIPDALSNLTFSFEDGVIPTDFTLDTIMPSLWEVSSEEANDGEYSLQASAESAFEITKYFQGNMLTFSAKSTCSRYFLSISIDGEEQRQRLSTEWKTFEFLIPKGRHTVRFESPACFTYLDNISFSSLDNVLATNTLFVTTDDDLLKIFNTEGELTRQVSIPEPDDHIWYKPARDLTVLDDGKIAIFNGTYSPSLSIYSPQDNLWEHLSSDDWSTEVNDYSSGLGKTSGGIASQGDVVFVTSMATFDRHLTGIIRFDLFDGSVSTIKAKPYIDLTIGLDGYLYAMTEDIVDKYNPTDMSLLVSYPISRAQSVAVDSQGNMYTASWAGVITRYDLLGNQISTIDTSNLDGYSSKDYLYDINIRYDGQLFVTNGYRQILITDTSLTDLSLYQDSTEDKGYFLDLLLSTSDIDNDGIPGWWENLYGLSDNDDTDAFTDLENDGVNNFTEYNAKTNPLNADTDGDTLDDFTEINSTFTSPILADSDNDGLTDLSELYTHSTQPLNSDSDGDLVNDGDEVNIYQTSPLDSKSTPVVDLINFDDGIIPDLFTHPESSDADWSIDNDSIKSGEIYNGTSSINYTKTYAVDGILTFDVIIKAEYCCNDLMVIVDDENYFYAYKSSSMSLELSAGTHNITFTYFPGADLGGSYDGVWIDNLLFTPTP